jgi:nucleoside-diphosphate-sugar epimerase
MRTIDKTKPVAVTGVTGYLASWVVKLLLEEGYTVRGTVRNKKDQNKIKHLLSLAKDSKGKLEFFEADLLKEHSFDTVFGGCELVIHTASPFILSEIKDAKKELIDPALIGTQNVLHSVNKASSVKRVVLTSSVVAMYGDAIDIANYENGILTEKEWNTTSSENHQPYGFSKMLAEKEAWTIAETQNQWDLVVINPGFVLGPSLDKNNGGVSNDFMNNIGNGKFKTGVPKGNHAIIDVRDAAKAHILAGFTPSASGRHITAAESKSFLDIAQLLKKHYPDYPLPKGVIPKPLAWLMGPHFGLTRKYVSRNFGYNITFDNSYIKKDLGIEFIPFEKTILDHFEQLVKDKII